VTRTPFVSLVEVALPACVVLRCDAGKHTEKGSFVVRSITIGCEWSGVLGVEL
jgi:hypothetical protein